MLHMTFTTLVAFALAAASAMTLSFDGRAFQHRWSSGGQHEFTPEGETDLAAWTSMLTIVEHDAARDGEQLASLANRVLGNYQSAGKILRTESKPRTPQAEAEHFIAAVLGSQGFLEAVFARVLLVEGRGVVVVYSHRVYGKAAGDEMSAWLKRDAAAAEQAVRGWTGMPTVAALKALPQSKPERRP